MDKRTVKAVKRAARNSNPIPPGRVHQDKKKYSRKEKHRRRHDGGDHSFAIML